CRYRLRQTPATTHRDERKTPFARRYYIDGCKRSAVIPPHTLPPPADPALFAHERIAEAFVKHHLTTEQLQPVSDPCRGEHSCRPGQTLAQERQTMTNTDQTERVIAADDEPAIVGQHPLCFTQYLVGI